MNVETALLSGIEIRDLWATKKYEISAILPMKFFTMPHNDIEDTFHEQ